MMYAFDPKHVGIMRSMDLSDFSLTEDKATPENTVKMLSRLAADREAVQERMAKRFKALRQEARVPAYRAAEILS